MIRVESFRFLKNAVIALACLSTLASPTYAQQTPPPAIVETANATNEMMAPQVFMPGTVVSLNDSRISSEITGRVLWVAAEGTLVKKGDVLARIDDRVLKLNVAQNKSQIKRLQARLKYLRSDLARTEDLAGTNHVSISRLEQAQSTLVMTEQELVQAGLTLEQSEITLERSQVRAPFPGRVVARLAQVGEYSVPGRQMVRLVDTEHLEVSAQAPVALAGVLRDKLPVSIRRDGIVSDAFVRAIVPVGDTVSRTMEIRIAIPKDLNYVVGAAVQVGLPSSEAENVVAVPRDALVLRREGTYVFRVKDDNTAERILVRTGAATGSIVAVSGGIEGGDQVIIRGGERLQPGQSVTLRELTASNASNT